jgi:hypothetical protein
VRRFAALPAALAAALVFAPAALATQYTVNDPGDVADAGALSACAAPPAAGCTLRAAIREANFNPSADTIDFTGAGTAPGPLMALDPITDTLTIDGSGATTVTFDPAATGRLFDFQTADSTLRSLVVTGGAAGSTAVNLAGGGDRLDRVTVRNTPGVGMRAAAGSVRIDSPRLDATGGGAIVVLGPNVTISSPVITSAGGAGIETGGGATAVTAPEISGGSAEGIRVSGDGAAISGGRIHGNAGHGVSITGQNDSVSRVAFFGNGGRPIANAPGANGGIAPPQGLRIGPRRPDGSLPLTGNAPGGTVELWRGDPASATEPAFSDAFSVAGDFSYAFPSEPAPGTVFSASVISGGSSDFATVAVPEDVSSPDVVASRALDTNNVRVDATEPLDPASVQKEDFTLVMAGQPRAISSVAVSPDGRFVTLTSSGWRAGEAGSVELAAPGAITDTSGNASLAASRLRVFAAPGDFVAPLGAKLALSPKTICLTRGRKCRKPGMTIKFGVTEPGKATLVVRRGNVQIGKRLYGNIVAGTNTLKFNGRLGARKLRAGRYRLLMYVQDVVGNVTDQPPIQLFSVRRTTK